MESFDEPLKDWQRKVKCAKCEDVIYSRYDGEYVSCSCGAIAVDQTPFYARHIGNTTDFFYLKKKENDNP